MKAILLGFSLSSTQSWRRKKKGFNLYIFFAGKRQFQSVDVCIDDPIFNSRADLKGENYEENNNDDAQLIYREIKFFFVL